MIRPGLTYSAIANMVNLACIRQGNYKFVCNTRARAGFVYKELLLLVDIQNAHKLKNRKAIRLGNGSTIGVEFIPPTNGAHNG